MGLDEMNIDEGIVVCSSDIYVVTCAVNICRDKPSVKKIEKKKQKKKERLGEFQEGEGEDDEGRWEKVKGGVPLVKVK